MEEKNISELESLAIIQAMISKTKQQLNDRSKYFFMWGFAVFIYAITQYFMLKNLMTNTQIVWLAMPIIAIIHIYMAVKEQKALGIRTHNEIAIQSLWIALGIGFVVMAIISFKISFDMLPFLILFYGIGTFVTGKIIQFKPLIFGGLTCFLLSTIVVFIDGPEQLLVLAFSVIAAYIIPAILLRSEFKNQQNKES